MLQREHKGSNVSRLKMCQAVDSNSQWPVNYQALFTSRTRFDLFSLGQVAFSSGVSHEDLPAAHELLASSLQRLQIYLSSLAEGLTCFLEAEILLFLLYIFHVTQGPGFSSYHGIPNECVSAWTSQPLMPSPVC